ncbi:MAG: inositol monophosphatase family protein [Candidatus Planktophila sp.]|jgi:myo-inositol-1(or 4)-monophosphatase
MYAELLELARKVGHDAGALLMERPPAFEIESKSTAIDIATQMDKKAEKFIMESLLAARPDDGIIGEEGSSVESKSGITWVIDPLDGTVNYFYGLPGWNVSIAAKDKDGSVVGVVTAPTINSTWWATRGGGAFYNGHQIHCNDPIALDRALIATGFQYDVAHRTTQMTDLAKLVPLVRDLRRNGAAAVDLCHVAMGALDGYYEAGLKEWDWAAGGLVATEAGARFVQYGQEPLRTTLAAGPTLHGHLASLLGFTA